MLSALLACSAPEAPDTGSMTISHYDSAPDIHDSATFADTNLLRSWCLLDSFGDCITPWSEWSREDAPPMADSFVGMPLQVVTQYRWTGAADMVADTSLGHAALDTGLRLVVIPAVAFDVSENSIALPIACLGSAGTSDTIWYSLCKIWPYKEPINIGRIDLGYPTWIVDSAANTSLDFMRTSDDTLILEQVALPRPNYLPQPGQVCIHTQTLVTEADSLHILCKWSLQDGTLLAPRQVDLPVLRTRESQ